LPSSRQIRNTEKWEQFIRRSINLFYQCAAVEDVKIGQRGQYFYHWEIRLYAGNDPLWLKPYLAELVKEIRRVRNKAGLKALEGIRITTPDLPAVSYYKLKK
jgi:ATP-dependent helicase IRC3